MFCTTDTSCSVSVRYKGIKGREGGRWGGRREIGKEGGRGEVTVRGGSSNRKRREQ